MCQAPKVPATKSARHKMCLALLFVRTEDFDLEATLESGQVFQFNLDTANGGATLAEEIAGNSEKAYVVMADTTNIKNNTQQGTTATTLIRMLGAKAVSAATNALTWHYRLSSSGNDSGALTLSDSYIMTGTSLSY